ncbi:hypothetical protein FA95DRAFT_1577747 [Auriscalpium vulgare]|uniref:Uncharacterized protein n=1 Tax=Auriscalpium vulgare TaxID=40419 RepID=A0ACB8R5R9_9AGAM|nr:hypothetical protein FA95DRAFT_1577747 [Auriscalpium vulgare]
MDPGPVGGQVDRGNSADAPLALAASTASDIWQVLAPAAQYITPLALAVREVCRPGSAAARRGTFALGIDARMWLEDCKFALSPRSAHEGMLHMAFLSLLSLQETSATAVFVGNENLNIELDSLAHAGQPGRLGSHAKLSELLRELVAAFGFYWHEAPGSIAASLAGLNVSGAVDAVVTPSPNPFAFGARVAMRSLGSALTCVAVYTSVAVTERVQLSHGGHLLIALLQDVARSQSVQAGLAAMDMPTAVALARSGLGDALLISRNEPRHALDAFLVRWRLRLQHVLGEDPDNILAMPRPDLARALPPAFPRPAAVLAFAPAVTVGASFRPRRIHLAALASMCTYLFDWPEARAIEAKFRTALWPACLTRDLMVSNAARSETTPDAPGSSPPSPALPALDGGQLAGDDDDDGMVDATMEVCRLHLGSVGEGGADIDAYRVTFSPTSYGEATRAGLHALHFGDVADTLNDDTVQVPMRTWVPCAVLQAACPELVAHFEDGRLPEASYRPYDVDSDEIIVPSHIEGLLIDLTD